MNWKFALFSFAALHQAYALSPASLMTPIVQHPAVQSLAVDVRPRAKLQKKHKHLFESDTSLPLFNQLGQICCETGVVPRKEFLETYAAATFIHAKFPHVRRCADLAAGHGLLSWFLLAFDHGRTAIAVDRRMPNSAEVIAAAMLEHFPDLEKQWTYVEADLSTVTPHSSTLLTSVHACGALSDYLVEMAINGAAPLALVPCCHSLKGYTPHTLSGMNAEDVTALLVKNDDMNINIAEVIDEVRYRTLVKAGYKVEEAVLPELFTKRNRLYLATPTPTAITTSTATSTSISTSTATGAGTGTGTGTATGTGTGTGTGTSHQAAGHHRQPVTSLKVLFNSTQIQNGKSDRRLKMMISFNLPLADDPTSIAYCNSAGGRAKATARSLLQKCRDFIPTLDISLWLPTTYDYEAIITIKALEDLANTCITQIPVIPVASGKEVLIECRVELLGDVFVHPTTSRCAQAYRVHYRAFDKEANGDLNDDLNNDLNTPIAITRKDLNQLHEALRASIEKEFEGVELR